MSEFKEIKGIFANLNNQKTNKILSNENIKIIGEDSIEETFKDKKYKIGPSSFFQVNPYNAIQLFDVVKNQIKNNSTILDAYGGVGAIGIYASEKASQITLVEENENAVLMAKENYKLNNIKNYEIYKGDACIHLNNFIKEKRIFDYVILDPPRQGCSTDTLKTMSKLAKNIIYVSCNPITLKRDMEQLISDKFKPDFVQGVDLFPYTHHIETVVLLSKGEVDSKKIRVEFSLEDMDMSEFQDGATYTQIKDYVLEHSGLKVSNLYISQIKRKCGIEVGKNYNLPKSEDSRQPLCPPEKEKAIREAFKYFGII